MLHVVLPPIAPAPKQGVCCPQCKAYMTLYLMRRAQRVIIGYPIQNKDVPKQTELLRPAYSLSEDFIYKRKIDNKKVTRRYCSTKLSDSRQTRLENNRQKVPQRDNPPQFYLFTYKEYTSTTGLFNNRIKLRQAQPILYLLCLIYYLYIAFL